MSRSKWSANLDDLCRSLAAYIKADLREGLFGTASRFSDSLFLSHSTSDSKFSAICRRGYLISAAGLAAEGGVSLSPASAEALLGTAGNVFFYVAPFRYPNTGCGLLFANTLESEHENGGVASPFDSGGLIDVFTRSDQAESPQAFLSRHELPVPEHRQYLGLCMNALFHKPQDYVDGSGPYRPGPIGLIGGDQRRWTHEVRIPDRVFLRGSHLQAAFAPKARIAADSDIEGLFQWCSNEGVDRISFDTPRGNDFAALQRECVDYFRRKVN